MTIDTKEPLTWQTMTPLQRLFAAPLLGLVATLGVLLGVPMLATGILLLPLGVDNRMVFVVTFAATFTLWFLYLRRRHGIDERVSLTPLLVAGIVALVTVRGIYNALQ
jgi:hypothetical protein